MRFAVIGRSELLLVSTQRLIKEGHDLTAIISAPSEATYSISEKAFEALANAHRVPYALVSALSLREIDVLRDTDTEVAVSVNWPQRIHQTVIDAVPRGILNVHAGDIPRYRGNACLNWAILRMESEVAVVVHQMVGERIDSGPILKRRRRALTADTYIGDLYAWLLRCVPLMICEVLADLDLGVSIAPLVPHAGPPLRCYPRVPSDSKIDWTCSAEEIHALVRASSRPLGGAFSYLGSERVTVWRASPGAVNIWGEVCAMPGQLLRGPHRLLGVSTGTAPLTLEEFEVFGEFAAEAMRTRTGRLR